MSNTYFWPVFVAVVALIILNLLSYFVVVFLSESFVLASFWILLLLSVLIFAWKKNSKILSLNFFSKKMGEC